MVHIARYLGRYFICTLINLLGAIENEHQRLMDIE